MCKSDGFFRLPAIPRVLGKHVAQQDIVARSFERLQRQKVPDMSEMKIRFRGGNRKCSRGGGMPLDLTLHFENELGNYPIKNLPGKFFFRRVQSGSRFFTVEVAVTPQYRTVHTLYLYRNTC